MKNLLSLLVFSLFSLVLFSGCQSTNSDGPYLESHTGAEDSEDFIQDAEIEVTSKAAIQFAILSLHEGDEQAATQLKEDLDRFIADLSDGQEVFPAQLLTQVKSDLSADQVDRLKVELAEAERHLFGKLETGSLVDTAQDYTTKEVLGWMRTAAEWSANGYNYDIVCSYGIALDHHKHNPGEGIRVDLSFLNFANGQSSQRNYDIQQ